MANTNVRLPLRARPVVQRKADENATSRHARQPSGIVPPGASRFAPKDLKTNQPRPVLSEVTLAAVNSRKDPLSKLAAGSDKPETGVKRGRSNSTALAAQRVPLGPGRSQVAPPVANVVNVRAPPTRALRHGIPVPAHNIRRTRVVPPPVAVDDDEDEQSEEDDEQDEEGMDVEDDEPAQLDVEADDDDPEEVQAMAVEEDSEEDQLGEEVEEETATAAKPPRVWPEVSTERAQQYQREVQAIRQAFVDDVDIQDTTMVSEYAEEIFEYMNDLEVEMMPGADYMTHQNEITWAMRQTLVDWLLQVHLRYHMLPETLWIAVNIVDRFLTHRTVSLVKLQLVGVTAMFIAAKYEEILAPSVDEFVYMTENGYNKEEILKGERIMLQTLEFRISHYCSPYRLSKFLTEVTLLDYRFLRAKPSLVAAVGMYCARKMLDGAWNEAFVFYSGYTEDQLVEGHDMLVEKLTERNFSRQYVCRKYAHKKFLKASSFAIEWAKVQVNGGVLEGMMLEE